MLGLQSSASGGPRSGHRTLVDAGWLFNTNPLIIILRGSIDRSLSAQSNNRDAGTIVLKIKKVQRVVGRAANPLQDIPLPDLGMRKTGDAYISYGYLRCINMFS